tara:strand:- start:378 stop:809 length:432 start_codon:yes stop_codon:yes gene_type:complete
MKTKRNFRKLSNKKKTRKNRKQIGGFIGRFFRKSDDKLRPKELLKRRRKQLIKAIEEEQRNSDEEKIDGIEKKIKSLHLEYLQLRNKVDDDIMAEIIEKNVENGRRKFYYLSNMYTIEYLNSPEDHPVIKKEKTEREKIELVV